MIGAHAWTVEGLTELRRVRREGADLSEAAAVFGVTPHVCNRALDALLGRTPPEALAALDIGDGRGALSPPAPPWSGFKGRGRPRHGLRRFLGDLFGGQG